MNTIKFTPRDEMRKETSNVEVFKISDIEIKNKKYKYYSDAQISLYVTKKCNASCPFCMNCLEKRCVQSNELDDKKYYKMLDYYLEMFKNIKPWITITGGEPTISKKLVPTLKMIKEKGYKIRTFSTNGSHLLDTYEGKYIIQYMLENNVLNNVNISRMAIDDEDNSKLMRISKDEFRNKDLKIIATYAEANDIEIRLSCNLLKNGVKNLDDILRYKEFYNNLGIKTVMFRELIPLPYKDDNYINIDDVFEEIENNKDFELLRVLDGLYYIVKVYNYKDYIVKCYKEKGYEDKNVIREFVIYPDGKLDNGFDNETLMEVEEL